MDLRIKPEGTNQHAAYIARGSSFPDLVDLPPHKIFLWDKDARYIDCAYPNPVSGHFLGSQQLIGRKVVEVLPHPASIELTAHIQQTLARQSPCVFFITLVLQRKSHKVMIRLTPLHQHVIGFINDLPAQPSATLKEPYSHHWTQGLLPALEKPSLTVREQEISMWVGQGKTNEEIGLILGISKRTVKYHLENIFKKLNITSRTQISSLSRTGSQRASF